MPIRVAPRSYISGAGSSEYVCPVCLLDGGWHYPTDEEIPTVGSTRFYNPKGHIADVE
jgi:hypothetical protein